MLSYDVMGNIATLKREPLGINNINTYTYNGTNQLKSISGFINGIYDYDVNGNLETDGPKGDKDRL